MRAAGAATAPCTKCAQLRHELALATRDYGMADRELESLARRMLKPQRSEEAAARHSEWTLLRDRVARARRRQAELEAKYVRHQRSHSNTEIAKAPRASKPSASNCPECNSLWQRYSEALADYMGDQAPQTPEVQADHLQEVERALLAIKEHEAQVHGRIVPL